MVFIDGPGDASGGQVNKGLNSALNILTQENCWNEGTFVRATKW